MITRQAARVIVCASCVQVGLVVFIVIFIIDCEFLSVWIHTRITGDHMFYLRLLVVLVAVAVMFKIADIVDDLQGVIKLRSQQINDHL